MTPSSSNVVLEVLTNIAALIALVIGGAFAVDIISGHLGFHTEMACMIVPPFVEIVRLLSLATAVTGAYVLILSGFRQPLLLLGGLLTGAFPTALLHYLGLKPCLG